MLKRSCYLMKASQALIDARERENINIFLNQMIRHHCQHLASDIEQYNKSVVSEVVDKVQLKKEMVDKWSIKLLLERGEGLLE